MKSNLSILELYVGENHINEILTMWNEPHRYYHSRKHLDDILKHLEGYKNGVYTDTAWDALVLAAYLHDVVYIPGEKDNEEKSAEMLMKLVKDPMGGVPLLARDIILSTKDINPKDRIFEIFRSADCWPLIYGTYEELLENELAIFKEFQKFSWDKYKKGRMDFLDTAIKLFPQNFVNLSELKRHVSSKRPRIGIYAGSFNPFHYGHLNVLEQAEQMFDKVVIAYGRNTEKEQRSNTIPKTIEFRENVFYSGFLSTLLNDYEDMGCDVTLIRGLRNEYDLNYEQNLVQYIKDQKSNLKVVFFLCDRMYEHLSSGAIRGLQKFGDDANKYVVP